MVVLPTPPLVDVLLGQSTQTWLSDPTLPKFVSSGAEPLTLRGSLRNPVFDHLFAGLVDSHGAACPAETHSLGIARQAIATGTLDFLAIHTRHFQVSSSSVRTAIAWSFDSSSIESRPTSSRSMPNFACATARLRAKAVPQRSPGRRIVMTSSDGQQRKSWPPTSDESVVLVGHQSPFKTVPFAIAMPLVMLPMMPTKPWSVPQMNRFSRCVRPSSCFSGAP